MFVLSISIIIAAVFLGVFITVVGGFAFTLISALFDSILNRGDNNKNVLLTKEYWKYGMFCGFAYGGFYALMTCILPGEDPLTLLGKFVCAFFYITFTDDYVKEYFTKKPNVMEQFKA